MEAGHTVTGLDWVPNKWQKSVDAITHQIDLRDSAKVRELMETKLKGQTFDVLVHLAANARVYELVEDPTKALDNFTTLFNALELARLLPIKRFIFASSRESYGNIDVEMIQENMARVENCESPYTASKIGGEALVHSYRRCYDIGTVIFRFSNVYGMYDDSERVVPLFIRLALANKPMTVFGKDKCLDFTYIDDTVSGIMKGIEKFDSVNGEVMNLAFGEGNTILKLAETIKAMKGSTADIILGKPRIGEIIHYVADITKAREKLGYDPKISFDEGVKKAVEWYAKNT